MAGKAAMDFSSGMVDIQQKAELTNAETDRMAASIMQMARASHQLPEDMRAGIDRLSGFGMDPRQAIRMIGPISRLGTAFKVDLADGSAAAFANFNNLKVPLAQTTTALNMMAAGSKVGSFEVADMARNFPALTARLQALGDVGTPAVADLTAALEMAMNTAGSADEAANNIGNLLGKINSPTVINAFAKKFGMDLPAAMKRFQAQGMTTMEAFATATQKATGGDMKKLGWVVEDQQAQMGLIALMQNMDKYRAMREQIQNQSAGTIDAAFGQREARDASVQWQDFTGQLQRMAIVVGTRLLPQFMPFLSALASTMDRAGQWADANPRLASGLASLGGVVAARIGFGALQFRLWQHPRAGLVPVGNVRQSPGAWHARQHASPSCGGLYPAHRADRAGRSGGRGGRLCRLSLLGADIGVLPAQLDHDPQPVPRGHRHLHPVAGCHHLCRVAGLSALGPDQRRHEKHGAHGCRHRRAVHPAMDHHRHVSVRAGRDVLWLWHQYRWGLIRGIVSMTGAVINAFLSLAGAVGARFAAALGIHSPSRVFMAMGAMSPMACGSGSMAGVMARPLRPGAWRWAWPQPVPSPSHRPAPLPCPAWVGRGQRAAPRMQPCRWQAPSRSPSRSTPRPAWM
jgi:hypothetical protein